MKMHSNVQIDRMESKQICLAETHVLEAPHCAAMHKPKSESAYLLAYFLAGFPYTGGFHLALLRVLACACPLWTSNPCAHYLPDLHPKQASHTIGQQI